MAPDGWRESAGGWHTEVGILAPQMCVDSMEGNDAANKGATQTMKASICN